MLQIVPNSVLQAMLPWIKLWIFLQLLLLQLVKNVPLLARCELLAINSLVFADFRCEQCGILLFFSRSSLRRGLLLNLGRLNIILGFHEVQFDIGLDAADLVIGLGLFDIDCVVPSAVLNVNRVALVQH